jgi:membrane-associated phospholipid phosphatase
MKSLTAKLSVLTILAFAALAIAVETRAALPGDEALYRMVRHLRHASILGGIGEVLAGRAIEIVFGAAVAAIFLTLIARGHSRIAAFLAASLVPAALTPILKDIFHRQPPVPLPSMSGDSFPSGHAVGSMTIAAVAVALAARTRWYGPISLVAAVFVAAVGVSAAVYGNHWPSDVLAGWLLGFGWTGALCALVAPFLVQSPR